MQEHAGWMMEGDTIRVFELQELEVASDTTSVAQDPTAK